MTFFCLRGRTLGFLCPDISHLELPGTTPGPEGALCIKHTDGNIYLLLDMIVSAGPDGLNPIEPVAGMELSKVKELVGRDFPFGSAWNHSRLGMLPIVTECAPPEFSASVFFPFFTSGFNFWVSTSPIQGFQAPWPGFASFMRRPFSQHPNSGHLRILLTARSDDRRRQRQPLDAIEDRCEQSPRHSHFRQLERHIFRVPRYLRPDLDEFLS